MVVRFSLSGHDTLLPTFSLYPYGSHPWVGAPPKTPGVFSKVTPTLLYKETVGSPEFPSYPYECMTLRSRWCPNHSPVRSQDFCLPTAPHRRLYPAKTPIVAYACSDSDKAGAAASACLRAIHVSGLNTDPATLIHLASDSRHRVYPHVSLPPCRLRFRRMGLELLRSHPLGNSNQFQYLYTSQGFGFISARAAGVSALSAKCQHTKNNALKLSFQRMATLNQYDTYLTSEPLTPDKLRGE